MLIDFVFNRFMSYNELLESLSTITPRVIVDLKLLAYETIELANVIEDDLTINTAYRTLKYELSRGRKGGSFHVKKKAIDFVPKNVSLSVAFKKIHLAMVENRIAKGGLKQYNTFIHRDSRGHIVLF